MARILLVDDDPLILRALGRVLRRAEHDVTVASGGRAALRQAGEHRFDLALVDQNMPDLDGLQVLQALRILQPACRRMLISGDLEITKTLLAVNDGHVCGVVPKPVMPAELLQLVASVLESGKRAQVAYIQSMERSHDVALARWLGSARFHLALQPVVRAASKELVGVEAFLRGVPDGFDGPPAVFRQAQEQGLLAELGGAVVARASAVLCRLPPPLLLFLNLHPDDLADPGALAHRLAPLEPWSRRVVLDITEECHQRWPDRWAASARRLQSLGFRIALDDMGSGYSALRVLADIEPAFIKADLAVVRGIDQFPRKRRLLELLQNMATATGATLVAEGVETEAEAAVLQDHGVPLAQGFLYGRPSVVLPAA